MDVVVFADQDGRALGSGFARRIEGAYPDVVVIPALFGIGADSAGAAAGYEGLHAVLGDTENAAMLAALDTALTYDPGRICVIATEGYAVSQLPVLARRVMTDSEVLVVDTQFDAGTLRPRSAEEYHQRFVMPTVLADASGGRLPLSGAHGLAVLGAGVVRSQLVSLANAIAATASDGRDLGTPVAGGALTGLLLLAVQAHFPVTVTHAAAGDVRDLYDLTSEQCARQLSDVTRLIRAIDADGVPRG